MSKFQANDANTANNSAYWVSNFRMGHLFEYGHIGVEPFVGVYNLFDEGYNANVRLNAFGGRYFEPGPERNFYGGLRLRYDFGS